MWVTESSIIQHFENNKSSNASSFAFLITGLSSTKVEKILKLINCPQKLVCGETCQFCKNWETKSSTNFLKIKSDGSSITKDQIESLKNWCIFIADRKKNIFFLIEEADLLNSSANSLLLKFLEDTNYNFYGFLLTNKENKISPVLLSRLKIFNIKKKRTTTNLNVLLSEQEKLILEKIDSPKKEDREFLEEIFLPIKKESDLLLNFYFQKKNVAEFLIACKEELIFENFPLFIRVFFEETKLIFQENNEFANFLKKYKPENQTLYNLIKKIMNFYQEIEKNETYADNLKPGKIDFLLFLNMIAPVSFY